MPGSLIFLLRFAIRWMANLYGLALLALLAVLHWRGEACWPLALLLYVPAPALLLPMVLLLPACLLFGAWRAGLAQLFCAALLFFGYMTFGRRLSPDAGAGDLSVATWNIGESDREEVFSFVRERKPDVLLLQDAAGRGVEFLRARPGWHLAAEGQFLCLSRFPILGSRPLAPEATETGPAAARFELRVKGRPMAFYSVHLPTPRPELRPFLTRHPAAAVAAWQTWLQEHRRLTEGLAGLAAAEKEPLIVGGDFNQPDHGLAYHRLSSLLRDAFPSAGRGYGFTFPNDTHNPITRGPWLRLDYLWCSRLLTPRSCEVTAGARSQHRGVLARFSVQ